MAKFSIKGHWPILEFNWLGGPMIIMKTGDRQLHIFSAKRIEGKFFETKDGYFELDGEHEYRMSNQAMYFFSLYNAKPINIQGIERIQQLYRSKQAGTIVKELEIIENAIKDSKGNPIVAMSKVFEQSKDSHFTQDDIKFLIDYRMYEASDTRFLIIKRSQDKKVNTSMSSRVNTVFPLLIFSAIGITAVIIMKFVNPLKIFWS